MTPRQEALAAAMRSASPRVALRALKPSLDELRWVERQAMRMAREQGEAVIQRRTRGGIEVTLSYWASEDPAARWMTTCEHASCVGHATRKLAESFLSHPESWCETCASLNPHRVP